MERTQGEYGAEKNFIFDLKRRLDPEIYDFLWRKINLPESTLASFCRETVENGAVRLAGALAGLDYHSRSV
jgi:hypothetical protein